MESNPQIIDLTLPLSLRTTPCTIYPGDPPLRIASHATVEKDGYTVHDLHLGTHTGTHIDAPAHFVEGGRTIDQVGLDELRGRALVVDLTRGGTVELEDRRKAEWEDLEQAWGASAGEETAGASLGDLIESGEYSMLLVHTGWSVSRYPSTSSSNELFDPSTFFSHPYFSSSIAQRLTSRSSKIRLFGCDTPNPDETPYNDEGGANGYTFHEVLLGGDGLIAENLRGLAELRKSDPGGNWVVNMIPLKIEGVDGSPIRAFAHPRGVS